MTCCVRPEHIRIEREGVVTAADNTLAATIVSSVYLGDVRQYVCAFDGDPTDEWRIACLADRAQDFAPGDRVGLAFDARHVALLDRDLPESVESAEPIESAEGAPAV